MAEEYGETEARGLLEQRQRRKAEIREEIHRLDAELIELNRGAAIFLVDGEVGESIPVALATRRQSIREELTDLHAALGQMDSLISGAEEDLRGVVLEEARGLYLEAREFEAEAVAKLEKALLRLVPLLEGVHSAGRASYSLGLEAALETSRHFQRRNFIVENFLGTKLGSVYGAFMPHNRLQVGKLSSRLNELLPILGTIEDG